MSLQDCIDRATKPVYAGEPSIGSSAAWGAGPCTPDTMATTPPCTADGGSGGLLSSNATVNPQFADANKAWFGYCSGDSFSGDVALPVMGNVSFPLYFRGKSILEAGVATLRASFGLADAELVVLSGCSAGGQAVYYQADHVGRLLAAFTSARFVAAPGAGLFLDVEPFNNQPNTARPMYKWVFDTMNLSSSVNPLCVRDNAQQDPSYCFYSPHVLPYIDTPVFVSNSLVDAAQLSFVMQLGCDPAAGDCDAQQLAYVDNFYLEFVKQAQPVLTSPANGAWLVSCAVHMVQDVDGAWNAIRVQGITHAEAFANWLAGANTYHVVDVTWSAGGGPHGGNVDCPKYGPVPSPPRVALTMGRDF